MELNFKRICRRNKNTFQVKDFFVSIHSTYSQKCLFLLHLLKANSDQCVASHVNTSSSSVHVMGRVCECLCSSNPNTIKIMWMKNKNQQQHKESNVATEITRNIYLNNVYFFASLVVSFFFLFFTASDCFPILMFGVFTTNEWDLMAFLCLLQHRDM
jgi:hypothetical protein